MAGKKANRPNIEKATDCITAPIQINVEIVKLSLSSYLPVSNDPVPQSAQPTSATLLRLPTLAGSMLRLSAMISTDVSSQNFDDKIPFIRFEIAGREA